MKEVLIRIQSCIDTNDISSLFNLIEELDIEFNQQYSISDPLYVNSKATLDNVFTLNS